MFHKKIKDAIKNAIAKPMTDIKSTTALATKRALKEDFDEVVEKRAHLEYNPTFKKKLNEDQFKHSKDLKRII